MNLPTILTDAKKALAALTAIEATAVGLGVLDNADAGYVTAALGAATAAIVYLIDNTEGGQPKPRMTSPSVPSAPPAGSGYYVPAASVDGKPADSQPHSTPEPEPDQVSAPVDPPPATPVPAQPAPTA